LIDENTFAEADQLTENKRLIIAGWVNQVRLIDNKAIGGR
jgi:pantoate--beta-alanine ligase